MRAMIGTVLLCLLAAPTWAAEPPTEQESKFVISKELIALALQQPAASKPGFDEWNGRLDRARDKRSKAQRLFWIGLGTNLGGAILAGAGGASCDYGYYGNCSGGAALMWTGALVSVGGGVATIYSIFSWVSAVGDISDLDREGRIKGYLTLAPIPGGAQMAARFTF